ncbi:hypothetical protein [Candidatus Pantoea persica]|uniref:hypothetical protein n=1 Tax=Candidatus Pantoea persica TaxID=2518128 RepID=UPI00215DB769|nr:hypothetical protein [Candidatus Pantoea persica]MBA2815497.1 outer membrane autotransporter barrel domain-containing protein [Candidatus Pantoea persica]
MSNGTINVDIGVDGAATSAATNGWSMAAKQSQLFTASGSGAMNWQSANRIAFTGAYTEYTYNLASWVDNVARYSGPFSVATLEVVDSDGGAVRATNGAKATIDGKLAAIGSAVH